MVNNLIKSIILLQKENLISDMNLKKITAISNTGPLISVFQCNRVDLLKLFFSVIYITASELIELEKHGWIDEVKNLINEGLIKVIDSLTEQEKVTSELIAKRIALNSSSSDPGWENHLPEAEAMVIMKYRSDLGIQLILLDEKVGRSIAKELNLTVAGFPGILSWAGKEQILTKDKIKNLLQICQKQGTYYSNRLIEDIIDIYGR
jgi:predicted nucleic acid-binding protein